MHKYKYNYTYIHMHLYGERHVSLLLLMYGHILKIVERNTCSTGVIKESQTIKCWASSYIVTRRNITRQYFNMIILLQGGAGGVPAGYKPAKAAGK